MGRKSTKENKNIYQVSRENAGLTREKASELIGFLSADRLEKIESGKSEPHPDEILALEQCYKVPTLCNYYCSHECPIGRKYVPEVTIKELSQITLETLASLNEMEKKKNRLIEITLDGEISDEEIPDFVAIKKQLDNLSLAVDSLQLWFQQKLDNNQINQTLFNEYWNKSEE